MSDCIPVNPEGIPLEPKGFEQRVCWTEEIRKGESPKTPFNALTAMYAKTDDPHTWATLANTASYYEKCRTNGSRLIVVAKLLGFDRHKEEKNLRCGSRY